MTMHADEVSRLLEEPAPEPAEMPAPTCATCLYGTVGESCPGLREVTCILHGGWRQLDNVCTDGAWLPEDVGLDPDLSDTWRLGYPDVVAAQRRSGR